jgi:hypothetical protein
VYKKARYGFFRTTVYRRYPAKLKGDSYTPPWMGLQIICAGLLPAALVSRPLRVPLLAAFGATALPLVLRAWQMDRGLLPWVLPLSYLRAFGQGVGLATGLLAVLVRRR